MPVRRLDLSDFRYRMDKPQQPTLRGLDHGLHSKQHPRLYYSSPRSLYIASIQDFNQESHEETQDFKKALVGSIPGARSHRWPGDIGMVLGVHLIRNGSVSGSLSSRLPTFSCHVRTGNYSWRSFPTKNTSRTDRSYQEEPHPGTSRFSHAHFHLQSRKVPRRNTD